ncbi:hypothetical protein [Chryseobacterium aurantiacum]|uniref:hypothetical protein n=1 Tax=Chryseobacterium aurantiacum TaxID=2116499 RepID=UPI000D13DEF9|nr:hypothetical protein [Chryseobacterium aurantiacum]
MSVNIKSPTSYFFTDLSFIQSASDKAFGPINNSVNDFQITTTFAQALPAYAVTGGTLLFAQYDGSTDKVNILLKPNRDIGLGIKIKYFVYRGINASDLFKTVNGALLVNDTSSLEFLKPAFKSHTEWYGSNSVFTAEKVGYISSSSPDSSSEVIKKFFTKDSRNLITVEKGNLIGNFSSGFGGFEIVLDDGDFSQTNSDTGLNFDLKFATANSCALKADNDHPANLNIFGGKKNGNISAKIFRENVYKFMDPAAFYGSHVTNTHDAQNADGGKIISKSGSTELNHKTPEAIYNNIVKKFLNKNKVYIYIKSNRGRSYKFYKVSDAERVYSESSNTDTFQGYISKSFLTKEWPIIIKTSLDEKLGIDLGILSNNLASSNYKFEEVKMNATDKISVRDGTLLKNLYCFKLMLSRLDDGGTLQNISCLVNICYIEEPGLNNFFGNINLKSIYDKGDFSDAQGSFVNHLRPVIISDNNNIGVYNTKLVLHGATISANYPDNTDTFGDNELRTYILCPQISTDVKTKITANAFTAGNYVSNKTEYYNKVYNEGAIWKGIIVDNGVNIKSLVYHSKDIDNNMPIYNLGITQNEYRLLEKKVQAKDAHATNLSFLLVEDSLTSEYLKYKLRVQFDKKDGTLGVIDDLTAVEEIYVYTVDSRFFFTKNYSEKISSSLCEEFGQASVEFRPYEYWNGECGIDWFRRGASTWPVGSAPKIFDTAFSEITGSMPTQTDGNDFSEPFVLDYRILSRLKNEYGVYPKTWSLKNERECFGTWLSLNKGQTTTLNLRVWVKSVVGQLRLRFPKKYFKINNSVGTPDPSDSNYSFYNFTVGQKAVTASEPNLFELEITCLEEFPTTQVIEALADGKLAGILKAFPNAKKPKLNVLLIPVKIALKDSSIKGYKETSSEITLIPTQKKNLIQWLAQSQIKVNVEMFNELDPPLTGDNFRELDVTTDTYFTNTYVEGTTGSDSYIKAYVKNSNIAFKSVKDYLFDKLPNKYKSAKYGNYMKVFLIDLQGFDMVDLTTKGTLLGGFSNGLGTPVVTFNIDLFNSSIPHEVYHSLGIAHTFNRLDKNSLFTFKGKTTDNLMDYSHMDNKTKESTYHWQWLIARNAFDDYFF